jgi:diguanylate cyclase (GGDEF)-like protein
VAFLGRSRPRVLVLSLAFVSSIGILDYVTSTYLELGFLHVIPIAYVTWFAGAPAGFLFSLICSGLGFATHFHSFSGSAQKLILFWNTLIQLISFLVVAAVTSLKDAFVQEKERALHDPLTGAANRRMFREEIERELIRCRRYHHPFTVAFVDLDDFKCVNDTYGHEVGDTVLRLVAELIKGSLRVTDVYARLGGDEFALLLPETDYTTALVALHKFRNSLRSTASSNIPTVTVSIGAVTFDAAPGSVDQVLTLADRLMYTAKKTVGKNAVAIRRAGYDASMISLPCQDR